MSLSELAAFDAAYRVLQPLDGAGRRRALQWLSDALGETSPLRQDAASAATAETVPVMATGRRTGRAVKAAVTGGRRAKAVPAQPKRRGRRPKADDATPERAYRRMPAATEVMAAYRRVGSISGLAEQFDVPVYTVHAWARRLRREGYQIGRAA